MTGGGRRYKAFQDELYLYLVLEYSIGGEFFTHLRKANSFSNDAARFYAAGVALTFEYLHASDIVYRGGLGVWAGVWVVRSTLKPNPKQRGGACGWCAPP